MPRVMAARIPGSATVPKSQRMLRPLDDDGEILKEANGEERLATLVSEWDGTVLSIADIAARETDVTIAKHITDAQGIAALHFDEDCISKIVRDSGYRLTMLIEESTTVVGFMVYSYTPSCIHVKQIAIADAHRGRGLGRCAVTWLVEHARKAGLDSVAASCSAKGMQFYAALGFKQTGQSAADELPICISVKEPPAAATAVPAPVAPGPVGTLAGTTPAGTVPATSDPTTVPPKGKTVPPKAKGKTVPPKAKMQPAPKVTDASMSRGALVLKVFDLCDADGDKLLSEEEMRTFALCGGFEGSEQDWAKDFQSICSKCGREPSIGLDMVRFEQIINDGSAGQYTDSELQAIYSKLELQVKGPSDGGRTNAIRAVFAACDEDSDGHLNEKEMRRVANHIGFTGSDEEWIEEFGAMCSDNGVDAAKGIDLALFQRLVNDDTENGCFCSDADLEAVLTNKVIEPPEPKGPRTIKPPPRRPGPSSREGITLGLFKALDIDGDGYLNLTEMKHFASLIGFKCDDEKWVKEFELFCSSGEADPAVGVGSDLFVRLVNDRSDAGCYCSDGELRDMLKELNPNAGEISSRGTLITTVFRACDRDGDERLNDEELRAFARLTGFDGDDEAWSKEYCMLCSEVRAEPDAGVDIKAFTKLVNDQSERGCYCRDMELATMVRNLGVSTFSGGSGSDANGPGDGTASLSLTPVSRAAIIRTVFHLCDADGNKLLNEHEMRTFATCAGFDGSEADWAKEYRFVCSRSSTDPTKGLNPAKFIQVINNGNAGSYTDSELKSILEKLELQACLDAGASGRSGVVRAVFHACDLDSDGYLNRQEMKNIVVHVGFKGSHEEWAREYQAMCAENGADPVQGIDLVLLERLVNDSSETGCYCSDRDLRAVLQAMGETDGNVVKVQRQDSARSELIRSVFLACDTDRDGSLDELEMRSFATHVGFEGSNEDWAREYKILCSEKGTSGVDLILFEKLVNDNSESGCHCTDAQLQMILTKLNLGFR